MENHPSPHRKPEAFFRYPRTPHIAWLGEGAPRGDKMMPARDAAKLLASPVIVEEKLDGANMGVSLASDGALHIQNRGEFLYRPYGGQFSPLSAWLERHGPTLGRLLEEELILFGEWCAATHSLTYDSLPGWFLAFDVYDRRRGGFWNVERRDDLAHALGLPPVPRVFQGRIDLEGLQELAASQTSRFRQGPLEGLVIRGETKAGNRSRAKLVRAGFIQDMGAHWKSRTLRWNRLQVR